MAKADFYETLGVAREADEKALKSAYRKLAMQFHPDRNPDNAEAEAKFKEVNEAYETPKDPQKRAAYDRFGHAAFENGGDTREADFSFHYEIAQATQNKRFPEFLALIRTGIVPRVELERHDGAPRAYRPNPDIVAEHARIVEAIVDGDQDLAEAAMKAHLEGSLARYRKLLRSGAEQPGG